MLQTILNVVLILLIIGVVVMAVLYFLGSKLQKRQLEQEQLLEAARTDILNLTPDALTDVSKDPIVGYLNLNVKEYDEKNGVNLELKEQLTSLTYDSSVFVLRESYHNTLNLLNELGINPQDTRLDLSNPLLFPCRPEMTSN